MPRSAKGLNSSGVELDAERNNVRGKVTEISKADSKVKVFLIPTNEDSSSLAIRTAFAVNKEFPPLY